MVKIISVNGNIACGKSTLLRSLKEKGYFVVMEGFDRGEWGEGLSLFYKDPVRYGFLFQTIVLTEMKETYKHLRESGKFGKDDIVFVERSHLDSLAFTRLARENGFLSLLEHDTSRRLYDVLVEFPDVNIYLDLSPEVCFERCKSRARECESNITLDYLKGVRKHTIKTMHEMMSSEAAVKMIKLDVFGKSTDEILQTVLKSVKTCNK